MFVVVERFNTRYGLKEHYRRHVLSPKKGEIPFGDITMEEYEQIADYTQRMPVDNSHVFGYAVERDGLVSYNKYDKKTNIFVAYFYDNDEPLTISCYRMDFDKFMRRERYKTGDIPEGK